MTVVSFSMIKGSKKTLIQSSLHFLLFCGLRNFGPFGITSLSDIITKTRPCNKQRLKLQISLEKNDIFNIFAQNIDGYMLEPPL